MIMTIGNMGDDTGESNHKNPVEIRGVNNENRIRKVLGMEMRTTYGRKKIDPEKLKNHLIAKTINNNL